MSTPRGPEIYLVHWRGMPIDCARITTTKNRADEIIKQGGGEDLGTIYHLVDIETARALEKERNELRAKYAALYNAVEEWALAKCDDPDSHERLAEAWKRASR